MSSLERDILISRVVDGLASDTDWRSLESLGETDPTVWRELAVAQRQQALLCGAVGLELECIERVEMPDARPAVIRFPGATWKWTGWAAAAMVALAWMVGPRGEVSSRSIAREPGIDTATMLPVSLGPEDFLQSYIERGRQDGTVVGQMESKPVIEVRPVKLEGGTGYDVVYARVIVERTRLPDVYRLTTDEFGSSVAVRARLPQRTFAKPPM